MTNGTGSAHGPGCHCQECTEAKGAVAPSTVKSTPADVPSLGTIPKTAPLSERTLLVEEEVFRHLSDHIASESEFISAYRELAEAPATPEAARYLIQLILEDEERHHRVLHEIMTAVGNRIASRSDPDAVPNLPHEPPNRVLEEVTGRFLAAERADAKQLRALRKKLGPFRDTSMWALLVELIEHDTAKHIRILTFIRDHVVRQPRRYLAISRALDTALDEPVEPE